MTDYNKPVSGKKIFGATVGKNCIIMAANIRIQQCTRGIMEAAKEKKSAILFEIAKSEVGYTGQTPKEFYDKIVATAEEIGFDTPYAIHADHITIKDTSPEEFASGKKLIEDEIAAGFTSYAIDASHNYNLEAKNPRDALADNIEITVKLADLIPKDASLEVEVGEVGRTNPDGTKMLSTAEEAFAFIEALREQGVKPDLLATNNGTSHGNVFDKNGNVIAKIGIDLARTKAIADAIAPMGVRIAQHGTTGTPLDFIPLLRDCGIAKCNVGTNWQNIALETMPADLVKKMEAWTLASEKAAKMKAKKPNIIEKELIAKNIKYAIKPHKAEIEAIPLEYRQKLWATCKKSAVEFIDAFGSKNTADWVKKAK